MRVAPVLVLVTGCGRLGFGLFDKPASDAGDASGVALDVAVDVAPDGPSLQQILGNGLVGYWQMEDTSFLDSSPSGNAASTCYSSCPTLAPGLRGMAADFHNSEGLEVGAVAPLTSLSTGVTLAGWVNLRSETDYGALISTDRDCCSTQNGFSLWASRYQMYPHFDMWNQTQSALGQGLSPLQLSTWVFLVATYDNQTARLYVDGSEVGNVDVTGAIGTPPSFPLRIGHQGFDYMGGVDGLVDEVMIFDRPLSVSEIQTIYAALKP